MVLYRLEHGLPVVRAFQVQLQNVEKVAVGMQRGDVQTRSLDAIVPVIVVGAHVGHTLRAKQPSSIRGRSLFCRRHYLPRCLARLVVLSSFLLAAPRLRTAWAVRFGFTVQPSLEDPALTHVNRGDTNELLFTNASALLDQPAGLTQSYSVDRIAHTAGILKLGLLGPQL